MHAHLPKRTAAVLARSGDGATGVAWGRCARNTSTRPAAAQRMQQAQALRGRAQAVSPVLRVKLLPLVSTRCCHPSSSPSFSLPLPPTSSSSSSSSSSLCPPQHASLFACHRHWRPFLPSPPNTARRHCASASFSAVSSEMASMASMASSSPAVVSDRDILPGNFKPSHYDLVITDLDFASWTFKGSVAITGALTAPTTSVVINTLEIDITSAVLTAGSTPSAKATDVVYDEKNQRSTLAFAAGDAFAPADAAVLTLSFSGRLNHDLAGFYRSQYKPPVGSTPAASTPHDADFHYMLSTQFEACDARRAFPCFDEPNLKATFAFAIEIPDDLVALSNMPVEAETPVAGKDHVKLVRFQPTPVMSTYLLAWAVGDFEYIEAFTEGRPGAGNAIPARVYTTRGLKEQGRWALQHAPRYIDYYSSIFDVDYPLPKADILAVHEFTHGAMENWGLVTYRTTAILFDEELSDNRFRNRIAYVVAHELAHQWFGNLVTMDWWDELWLNEGFATWAGWKATHELHPEWDVWAQFVNEGMERALKLDSLRSSHPIQVLVRDALDVNQVFDAISYLKGCAVIRMLADHLDDKTFVAGVSRYLKKHAYGNARTVDLWQALSDVSGQDVNALMEPWIKKIGFPVLNVSEETAASSSDATTTLTVKQSRFLSTGDVQAADDTTTWWLPVSLVGRKAAAESAEAAESVSVTTREAALTGVSKDFYKLNVDATGFYRVNYPPERLATLGTQLDRLSASDKISIAGSAAELAFAGNGTTPALLSFLEGFGNEGHVRVLGQALDAIGLIKGVFGEDETIKDGLEAFTLRLIEKPLAKLGFDGAKGEDYNETELRKRLVTTAVRNGHPEITKEALRRFDAYVADPATNPLKADERVPVFVAAVKADAARAVPLLRKEWQTTAAPDGREVALSAMGATADAAVVEASLLPFMFGDDAADAVPAADVHILAGALAGLAAVRPLLWAFMQKEWFGAVARKLAGNPILLDRFVNVTLNKFSDTGALGAIEAFFADKDTKGFDRTLETVKDSIRGRAAYRTRETVELRAWLVQKGYA